MPQRVYGLGEAPDRAVTAKTRKRCPQCSRMVEVGESAVISDDRSLESCHTFRTPGMKPFRRGAWHLWHPACRAERLALVASMASAVAP